MIALLPVVGMIRLQVIDREERYLEAMFGCAYRDRKARVRRRIGVRLSLCERGEPSVEALFDAGRRRHRLYLRYVDARGK